MLWSDGVEIEILSKHRQFINTSINWGVKEKSSTLRQFMAARTLPCGNISGEISHPLWNIVLIPGYSRGTSMPP